MNFNPYLRKLQEKMNFFSDAVARLKYELRVSKDGEVAAALGLSKTAFAERKRRGAFPEKELYELAARQPELHLDVQYVLTGDKMRPHQASLTTHMLSATKEFTGGNLDDPLYHLAIDAHKKTIKHNADRKDRYQVLCELLDGCKDESVDMMIAMAEKMYLADVSKASEKIHAEPVSEEVATAPVSIPAPSQSHKQPKTTKPEALLPPFLRPAQAGRATVLELVFLTIVTYSAIILTAVGLVSGMIAMAADDPRRLVAVLIFLGIVFAGAYYTWHGIVNKRWFPAKNLPDS